METFVLIIKVLLYLAAIGLIFGIVKIFPKSLQWRPKIDVKDGLNATEVKTVVDAQYARIMKHREEARQKWDAILEKVKQGDERDMHLAIIKADSLVDEILIEHGCPGKDMGERLKSFHKNDLHNIEELWEAHKTRNRMAHDPDFHIAVDESKRIINIYHEVMEELLTKEIESV